MGSCIFPMSRRAQWAHVCNERRGRTTVTGRRLRRGVAVPRKGSPAEPTRRLAATPAGLASAPGAEPAPGGPFVTPPASHPRRPTAGPLPAPADPTGLRPVTRVT